MLSICSLFLSISAAESAAEHIKMGSRNAAAAAPTNGKFGKLKISMIFKHIYI